MLSLVAELPLIPQYRVNCVNFLKNKKKILKNTPPGTDWTRVKSLSRIMTHFWYMLGTEGGMGFLADFVYKLILQNKK